MFNIQYSIFNIQYWSDCIVLDIFKLRFLSLKSGAVAK